MGICIKLRKISSYLRTFLVDQWLRLQAITVGSMGSIPGLGTKIPYAAQPSQKKKKRERSYYIFLRIFI